MYISEVCVIEHGCQLMSSTTLQIRDEDLFGIIGCSKTYNTYDPVHLFLKQLVTSIVQAPSLYNFIRKQKLNWLFLACQYTSIAIVLHEPFYILVI